jgi:putative OPT family oligopeptide transporter
MASGIKQARPSGIELQAPNYEPYIAAETRMREFTFRAVATGTILGMIFGASSLYLVLKVGITVSASIPVAVISVTLFRILSRFGMRDATILEHNIVQTSGSAGESIAFGVGVTMPAILILGFDLELNRILVVSLLGGLLGVLMMIPLRRALIVQQHGILKYPEGTACAEVLKASASEESRALAAPSWRENAAKDQPAALRRGTSALTIFSGFGIGLGYKVLMDAFKMWKGIPETVFKGGPLKGGTVGAEISPELLGVGYIIGPRIACIMVAGGVLADLVLIPMITFFGSGNSAPVAPGQAPITEMSPGAIRSAYILYIGAGAVAAGGIISLVRSLPLIWSGIRQGLKNVSQSGAGGRSLVRTEDDLPMKVVFIGIAVLVVAITLTPSLHLNVLGAILIIVFGFLFVTVSSRLTGEIGSSSNPISGMTVATLLLTCLIFLMLGWREATYYVTALSVGAVVCIASSNGGTTSQDLKTGFLVGGTPRYQQLALFVGVIASAVILGPILLRLNSAATVYVPMQEEVRVDTSRLSKKEKLEGPQASADPKEYFVWHGVDTNAPKAGKYLVDASGKAVYYVDPGINGEVNQRPDGSEVRKFMAPKATLMSYIIKGILDQELPWGLVLFGAMISVVLELCGISSLAFAVGVYLPLYVSMPIFVGGFIRWLVDRKRRQELAELKLNEETLAADAEKSPGVLAASGYIAGGAIAGIVIAIVAGALESVERRFTNWSEAFNPLYAGDYSDVLALIPFAVLCLILFLVGREKLFYRKPA